MQELLSRLAADPYNLGPVKELERQFRSEVSSLVSTFEDRAEETDDAEYSARLLLEAGRLTAVELADLDQALNLVARAIELGEDTYVSIEAHLFDLALKGEAEELLGFFTESLEYFDDAGYQSRLYQRMGTILGHLLGDMEEAGNAYLYAVELAPDNLAARWAHQELARTQQDWPTLAELLYDEVENVEDAAAQARASVELGVVYRDHLGDEDGAAQCFQIALEIDPDNEAAREHLAEMGQPVDVEEAPQTDAVEPEAQDNPGTMELDEEMLLDEAPVAAEDPGTMELDEEMVLEEEPPATPAAQDPGTMELDEAMVLEEPSSEVEQDDPGTMELDEEMLLDEAPNTPPQAPPEFEDAELEEESDANSEVEVEEEESEVEEVLEADEEPEADIAEEAEVELGEESEADVEEESEADEEFEADEESEAEVDEESEAEADIEEASEVDVELEEESEAGVEDESEADIEEESEEEPQDTWHDRFVALTDQAREAGGGEESLTLLGRAARLESRHRQGDEDGLDLWRAAVELGVGGQFYRRTSYLWDTQSFWQSVFDEVDDDALKGRIAFFELGDTDQAQACAEAADDEEILSALEDLEAATDNWRKYQRSLEQRHDDLDGDEKAHKVYWHMANMAASLDDLDKQIDALRRLDRQVDDPLVSNRLKVLYKRAEKWPMYVDLVKKEVEALADDRELDKIDLLHEAIRVYREEMNHDMMVVNTYKEILEIDPENLEAIDALIEMYDQMNRASELINMLQEKVELVRTEGAKVEIYEQIAELFLEKFRNQAEAIKAYESILELRPHHAGAIEFLKEMYEKRRDWEKLIDVHKQQIETFETDEEKAEGFKEVAQLASDRLRNPEVATELWLEVRSFAPEDPSALDALETLYEKSRDYEKLADVLETKVDSIDDVDEQMKLRQKLGMLYSDRLEDSERAIAAWRGALELDPEDLKARKALERLYIDNRDWDALEAFYAESDGHQDLVRVLETLAGTIKEDEVKIELLLRAARIWREVLEDTGRAERDLERVLGIDERNEQAALQLEPITREKEDFDKLKEIFQIILEHREEPAERREYQLKLAELHADQLDDAQGAFRWYAQAFHDDPSANDVIEALEQAAAHADSWSQLADAYRSALDEELAEETRQQLRLRLGTVLSEQLDQLDEALAQFEAVLEEQPENLDALAAMERIYRRSERWDELMSVYRRRLELTEEVSDKVEILQGMADIAEQQAGDTETAIERYKEALELDEENETTLRQLHRLYADQQAHDELGEIIRREIALIEERAADREFQRATSISLDAFFTGGQPIAVDLPEDEAGAEMSLEDSEPQAPEYELEASELAEDGSGQGLGTEASDAQLAEHSSVAEAVEPAPDEFADEVFEAEQDSDVSDSALIEEASEAALDALSEASQADLSAEPVYTEEEIERLVELRFELGVICKDYLGEDEEAVDVLSSVLAWRPLHHEARHAIEDYLDHGELRETVASELTPVYELQGKWARLIEVLEIQLEEAEDHGRKVDLLERIGGTQIEELGHHAEAFETYCRLLRLEPDNEGARPQLRRVAAPIERWEELIDLYEELRPELDDDALQIDYLFDLGEMYGDRLGDTETAQDLYHQVLEAEPDSARALEELEALYARTEQWHELLSVYQRQLELAERDEEAEQLQFRIAVLHERLLDDPEEAIAVLKGVLDDQPENVRAVRMLNRLYRGQEMWHELADNIDGELELVEDEEKNEVKNRRAEVLEEHLDEYDAAIDLYEEVLDDEPTNANATAALEQLMHVVPAPRGRASRILEPLYIERDEWEKLVDALEVQVDTSDDPDERIELLHRIATLHEERGQRAEDAFDTYCRALRDEVENEATLEHLYRIAEQIGHFEELAGRFEAEADFQTDPEIKRGLLWRAARVCIEQLAELEEAARLLRRVQGLFPEDLETVETLEELYRQLQDFAELVDVLVTKAELVEEAEDKKQLLYQAGTTYEDVLEQPEEAVDVYRRVLEVDDADQHAIDRLEVIFTDLERWQELLEIYERKLELAEDDEARKDLLYAMGPIYREHLDAPFEAVETYRNILSIDSDELAALEKLDELFAETEQWNELLETLERQMELVAMDADRLDLRYRVGRLWETELGDVLRAIEVYREVLDEAPDHEATTEALEGLITRGEFEVEAAEVLQPIYADADEWEKLVHVYKLLIDASHDPERKLELYGEVARIYEENLDNLQDAFETHVEALGVDAARQEVLEHLERLAAELGAWEVLIDRLDETLEDTTDFEAITELNLRIARIYEEELQLSEPAIERFNQVLQSEPESQKAILALDRLYQREGQWENLAEILQTRVYNTTDPDEVLELRLRLGTLYQEALDRPDEAIEVYQTVLLDNPDNAQAIASLEQMFMAGQAVQKIADILEPHYLQKGQHEKLVEIYLQRLEMLDDHFERYELLMQVGRIFLTELEDEERALDSYGAALAEKPDDPEALERLEELARSTGGWGQAAGYYVDALDHEDIFDEDALTLWNNLARVLDEHLGQVEEAEGAYLQALEIDPGEARALEALDRIYENQQRYADLADVLQRRIEGLYDEDQIIELSYRLAQIFQHELDAPERAVDTYRSILDIRPGHEDSLLQLERIHLERQQWEELFEVLRSRAEVTHSPEEKVELFARMANLAEEMLERPLDAIDLWNEVLKHEPTDRDALGELQRLYLQEERWDDMVSVLEQEVRLTDEPHEQLELYDALGTIWQDKLDNELQALDAWQNVLAIDPEHLEALEALRNIYTRQGDYSELPRIVTRLIEHEQVAQERKLSLWIELAEIYGDMLMQPQDAIEAWKNVMSLDPGNALALENLEQLFLQESMWEEAAQVLEVKADQFEDDAQRLELLGRIADIWENKLFEPGRAVTFYEQMLDIDPTHMPASHSLENIYRDQGTDEAWQSLVELYLTRAEVVGDDPFERAETLRQAAHVFEQHLGQPESALLVQLSAFGADTLDDEQLLADLERLAEQTELWDELVGRAADVLPELEDGIDSADLHRKVGGWYADKLDQPDDAVYHLRRALGIEPDNTQILEKLEDLYRQLASWPELADIIEKRIALTSTPDERIELWRRLGELYEMQMAEIDEAVSAYREILLLDETDILAMESLERIFEAYDRFEDLIDILRKKAEATYDPDDIVDIKVRIAQIYDERLEDPQRAIDAYNEVLSVDQAHEATLEALEQLYLGDAQWHELLEIYERRLKQTHEPEQQVGIYGKMAAVYEGQFEDPESAVEAYNNILMVEHDHQGAIENLERLYRELERWFDLVEVLQRHVEVVEQTDRKVELLNELARTQRDKLDDVHAAVEAFVKSIELDAYQAEPLLELAGLQEQVDNYQAAVDAYMSLVDLLDDAEERAEIYARAGELLEQELLDDDGAEQAYLATLELVPGHADAIAALRRVYERKGDWQPLIRALKQAEDTSRDLDKKAEYLAEIGEIYEEKLDEPVSALNYYESALENNARNVNAAQPLIAMYMREQRWERAVPLLELVIEEYNKQGAEPETLHDLHLQAGKTFKRLEQRDDALEHFRSAYEHDSSHFETLHGLGHLLYENEDFQKAATVFENIEYDHLDKLETDELVELYYRAGRIQRRFGENRRSIEYFIKALDIDGSHRASNEALIELYEEQENWEQVVEYSRRMLESEDEPAARFALLTRMGDLLAQQVGDRNRAVAVYLEALDIEPESMAVLRKLLDLYTKTKQWIEAVEILDRLIEHETSDSRASKYNYTVGVIYRDEIGDPLEAVDYFDGALDYDVKMLKAFEAIDRILTEAKEWKELERAYRRMLKRVAENDDGEMENIKVLLWTNLGEIYRSRLGHVKSAIGAYEAAVGLNPNDEKTRLILAELYEKKAGDPEGAIEQHKELIRLDPFRIESYRALFKAYIQAKQYDQAWCMSAALSFLQNANEQEEKFYRQYLGQSLQAAKGQFKQELYRLLYHDDQELLISFIMSLIGQGLRGYYSRKVKKVWGVHPRKDKLDLDQQMLFCKIYKYSARTTGLVPAPEVYLKRDQALGIRNANAETPSVVIGADMMQGKGDRELAFLIGKQLCWMRPEHYMGSVGFPTENLKLLFMGAMHITDPSLGIAQQLGEQGVDVIKELQQMPAQMLTQVRKYMQQYLASGKNPNLSAWLTQVEHTCIRMGLVLCGDLHEAASCIKNDTNPIGKATVKEKIREMVLFSISDEYFQIRERLGLAIGK